MAEPPVVNASPLIFLARAGLLELLREAGDRVLVPAAVADEIRQRGEEDPTARAIRDTLWLDIVPTPPATEPILAWGLGVGESAVLAWAAVHPGTEAILDDLPARRCAAALGLPVRGTLGLVLVARQRGHVPAARPVLENLRRGGMWLSDDVLERALSLVGE